MKKDFKLIGYYVNTEYNDYSRDNYIIFKKEIEEVKKEIEEDLLKKENCDKYYNYSIREIYEIKNPEYYKFGFYNEIEEYGEKTSVGMDNYYIMNYKSEYFKLETPRHKVPKSDIILEKIYNISLVDCNGLVEKENIDKQIELLKQLKTI